MSHYSRFRMVVIDAPADSHDQELSFWQGALGVTLEREEQHPEYHGAVLPHQKQHALLVQRLREGPARVHLEVEVVVAGARVPGFADVADHLTAPHAIAELQAVGEA